MKKRFTLSSSRGHRRALRRNQIASLVLRGSLITTEARAKVLKSEVERLISRSKKADLATRRRVLALLPNNQAAKRLFDQIVPQFRDRIGGFVRVVKLSPRRGDSAPMARVEFVEKIAEAVEEKKRGKTQRESRKKQEKKEADNKISKRETKKGEKLTQRKSLPAGRQAR